MVEVEKYMNDGANWQAQAVLAYVRAYEYGIKDVYNPYLRHDSEKSEKFKELLSLFKIEVGRYENCREQGYIFSLRPFFGKHCNVAVFEHRNSDSLCLIKFKGGFLNTPTWEDVWKDKADKWDIDKTFKCGDITGCGEEIISIFNEFISDEIEKHIN